MNELDIIALNTFNIYRYYFKITGAYLPFWRQCKMRTLWTDAPHNVLFLLGQVRQMTKKVRDIVSPTIQRGSYCCHPETVLQALLCSQDEEDRRFAIEQIRYP